MADVIRQASLDDIRTLVSAYDESDTRAVQAGEDRRAVVDAAKTQGLHPGGFASALKLRKLKPEKMQAWLRTFDRTRAALALDAQLDLEDAIDEADKKEAHLKQSIADQVQNALAPTRKRRKDGDEAGAAAPPA
jgi:hypothetical protein